MLQLKIPVLALAVLCVASAAQADLEWITGGVPKNSTDKSGTSTVKDAPSDQAPSGAANQDVIVSHLITCTNILNDYPVNSVNFFHLDKDKQVCYYAYFLLKPSSRIHTATVECFSPSNMRVAKFDKQFQVGFTDRLLTIQNDTYQFFIVTAQLGLDHLFSEYGQTGLLRDLGLYTVHLTVDGQLVGITFFYIKPEETKPPQAIPTVSPAGKAEPLPMATPFSTGPIPSGIQ